MLSRRRSLPCLLLWAVLAVGSAQAAEPPTGSGDARPALSMEELRQRLSERVAQVGARSSQVPVVKVAVKPPAKVASHASAPARSATPQEPGQAPSNPHEPSHPHELPHWDYAGPAGPAAWGSLNPGFATCARGERQSPIDIREGLRVDLEPIRFDYRPVPFEVIDNGHTVQVNVGPGNAIEVNRQRYELLQFHFHRPSEERVDGRRFEMVAHLVHRSPEGRLAVVAVLIEAGGQHPLIQQVWNSLPLEKGEPLTGPAPMDLNGLLPEDRRYFTYMGSLTTPPCSEGVMWLVLKQPVDVAVEQIGLFARLYPMNARPLQATAGRRVKESN